MSIVKKLGVFGLLSGLVAGSLSCGDDSGGEPTPVPESIELLLAIPDSAAVGTTHAVLVVVLDDEADPVEGSSVVFSVLSGGGSVSTDTTLTDPSGSASTQWTLGTVPGTQSLVIATPGLVPITKSVTATAGPAVLLQKVAGDSQSALPGTLLPVQVKVRARDAFANPVPGVIVTYLVTLGGGQVVGAVDTTGADGVATLGGWQLGGAPLTLNQVSASTPGLTSLLFSAMSTAFPILPPDSITIVAGNGQTGPAGGALPIDPSVRVLDSTGAPLANVAVTFAPVLGGGSVTGAAQSTDSMGIATVGSWTLGAAPGTTNTLTASVTGLTPVTFTATTASLPPGSTDTMTLAAALPDSATVATTHTVSVLVRDSNGVARTGALVHFQTVGGGGDFSVDSATTNGSGIASSLWTLGTITGPNSFSATVTNGPGLTAGILGKAGPLVGLIKFAGDSQISPISMAVPVPPAVKAVDTYGNGVQGIQVTFAVDSGGGNVVSGSPTSNASGIAAVGSWTLGPTAGVTNTLSATASGVSPVLFSALATSPSQGEFDFLFETPDTNAHFSDTLYVQLLALGVHTLSGLQASIGGIAVPMNYLGPYGTVHRFGVKIPTASLPQGPVTLTVTAADVQGHSGQAFLPLIHNELPVVTVTAPWTNAMASPLLHIAATCADDGPTPCTLQAFRKENGGLFHLATATGTMDTVVDFAPVNNEYELVVVGTDSDGDTVNVKRTVLRQVRTTLTTLASLDGPILDYDGTRALYIRQAGDSLQLAIRTLGSGAEELIPVKSKFGFFRGRLHPTGAVFTRDLVKVTNGDQGTGSLHRWASGSATQLLASRSYEFGSGWTAVSAEGDYFAFGTTVVTMSTGAVTTLSGSPTIDHLDVGANGDVVITSTGGGANTFIRLYRAGAPWYTIPAFGTYPVTDGGRVVYNDLGPPPYWRSRLTDTLGVATTLAATSGGLEVPLGAHVMNHGWIAYSDSIGRIWTRSPANVLRLVSGTDWKPREVGPNGEVIYSSFGGDTFYFVGTASIIGSEIGVGVGRVYWIGSTPYKISYNTLYQVVP
jgi:hypothetical protein